MIYSPRPAHAFILHEPDIIPFTMPDNFCPIHSNGPGCPSQEVFFGIGGPTVNQVRCTCNDKDGELHTPIIKIKSTTPLRIEVTEDKTEIKK